MQLSVLTVQRPTSNKNVQCLVTTTMALLKDDGRIFVYDRNSNDSSESAKRWHRTSNEPLQAIDVVMSPAGLWCLSKTGNIYLWNHDLDHSLWEKVSCINNIIGMRCDSEGSLWCFNRYGTIFVNYALSVNVGRINIINAWEEIEPVPTTTLQDIKRQNYDYYD